ncbi:hypothetical protein H8E52_03435 [bacterium]|nr:hypothetical protein [bacterium]
MQKLLFSLLFAALFPAIGAAAEIGIFADDCGYCYTDTQPSNWSNLKAMY